MEHVETTNVSGLGVDTVDAVDSVVVKPLLRGWSHVLAFTVVAVLGMIMASVAEPRSASGCG